MLAISPQKSTIRSFIIGNVTELVGLYEGKVKDRIIHRFLEIRYNENYKVLVLADYGVAQLRRRVFFVELRSKHKLFEFPKPILPSGDYLTTRKAIGSLPSPENNVQEKLSCLYKHNGKLTEYQKHCQKGSKNLYNHIGAGRLRHIYQDLIMIFPSIIL